MKTTTVSVRPPFVKPRAGNGYSMLDVVIALLAPLIWGVYVFGARVITITVICILFSVLPEYLVSRFVFHKNNSFDVSAVITGIIVAFCLPVSVPLWLPPFASLVAVLLAKASAGGIGKNLFNPAAVGICVSYALFHEYMNVFTKPFTYFPALGITVDATAIAESSVVTPLEIMRDGRIITSATPDYFYGIEAGTIGAVSVLALALSLVYLLARRITNIAAPAAYLMTILVITFFTAYADSEPIDFALTQIFTGGVALVAVFMLSDYSTTPITMTGKIVFGILTAAITVLIRYFGIVHYGEYFAVIAANMTVPFIERLTSQRVYGTFIRRNNDG